MRPGAWLTVLSLVAMIAPAGAVETSGFTQGQWIGAAHATDAGTFTFCDVGTLFKSGTSLIVTKDRSSVWSMSLSDQRWHLPPGYHYPLRVRFDEGPRLDLESAAESTSVLRIVLPPDGTLLAMIRHGHSIQIISGSFDKRYGLEGSGDALERLETCVHDHLAEEVAARESAKASSQTLLAVGTVGVAIYLAPLLPMLVVAEVASPDYHPSVVAPSADVDSGPSTDRVGDVAANVADEVPATADSVRRTEVPLREEMGTYVVPVEINGIVSLDFTVDSGAAAVAVPEDVFKTLMRGKTISAADFLGEDTFVFADGSTGTQRIFRIKSLQVGDTTLSDVIGSVVPEGGSLLLGQSFLSRFSSWSMDNGKHVLVLEQTAQ
jgi:clan AA aspartic protease (TIGR02281 family)